MSTLAIFIRQGARLVATLGSMAVFATWAEILASALR